MRLASGAAVWVARSTHHSSPIVPSRVAPNSPSEAVSSSKITASLVGRNAGKRSGKVVADVCSVTLVPNVFVLCVKGIVASASELVV